ncbi:chymotrypsin-2-like [Sitodiplosis mosellana]|uniref:chymotrypsin-2-like n=1 Tax=Sitodiplosis mosellana TaxID=263140 RepID=UPI00244391CF|nr:chymotrypsin-2-like [Sitodiplosis mosellana]
MKFVLAVVFLFGLGVANLKAASLISSVGSDWTSDVKEADANVELSPLSSRIVGGIVAKDGQAPYQCSMQRINPNTNLYRHTCGCVIISEQWILSAAHCLAQGVYGFDILVGTNDWQAGGTRYIPKKIITHKKYNQPRYANDIVLIQVDKIEFNEKVQPIKYSAKFVESGTPLLATGWGQLSAAGPIPQYLQAVNLTAISNEKCQADVGTDLNVDASHLCTFTREGEGVCFGDSGGPLVSGDEVVGLAGWTGAACARGKPDGFTRISLFYDWIVANIE